MCAEAEETVEYLAYNFIDSNRFVQKILISSYFYLWYLPSRSVKSHLKYTNASVNNITVFIHIHENSVLSGRHVSTFAGSSLGVQAIQNY
jgi:hypothetical protein